MGRAPGAALSCHDVAVAAANRQTLDRRCPPQRIDSAPMSQHPALTGLMGGGKGGCWGLRMSARQGRGRWLARGFRASPPPPRGWSAHLLETPRAWATACSPNCVHALTRTVARLDTLAAHIQPPCLTEKPPNPPSSLPVPAPRSPSRSRCAHRRDPRALNGYPFDGVNGDGCEK